MRPTENLNNTQVVLTCYFSFSLQNCPLPPYHDVTDDPISVITTNIGLVQFHMFSQPTKRSQQALWQESSCLCPLNFSLLKFFLGGIFFSNNKT